MDQPLISVIIPVYKVEAYIHQCVDSIINQTYRNLEIILVDDGSPDNCPAICDAYAAQDSRVKVIHKENGGQSSARNAALDICSGEYIAFLDSDDWMDPTAYADVVSFLQKENVDIVVYGVKVVEGDKISVFHGFNHFLEGSVLSAKEVEIMALKDEIGGQPGRKVCHRKCWENLRFPEGRIYEDLAIAYCPFLYAERGVGFLDSSPYNYRYNPTSTSYSGSTTLKKAYHIFLAFRDHYIYAQAHYPDLLDYLAGKTAVPALTVCKLFFSKQSSENAFQDVALFLRENRKHILRSDQIPFLKKIAVQAFCISPSLLRFVFGFL